MSRKPPRLALAFLNQFGPNNEALAGDILEGYELKGSRLWLWRQLLMAWARGAFRSSGEIRPLQLVEYPSWQPPREDFSEQRARLNFSLGLSPVRGAGGLTIAAIIVFISITQPALWLLAAFGLVSGIGVGVFRIMRSRRRGIQPSQDFTTIELFNHHSRQLRPRSGP